MDQSLKDLAKALAHQKQSIAKISSSPGTKGDDGKTPIKGIDYFDGSPGPPGKDGKTPIKDVDYFDGRDGRTPIKGVDYFDGAPGQPGYTPIKGVDYFDGLNSIVPGPPGDKGDPGITPDISGKVDKVTNYSLVANTEIAKIHSSGSDNQDLSNLVIKETGKSLVVDSEISKIHANTLDHSNSLDHSHLNKVTLDAIQQSLTTTLKTSYDEAVTHASSAHAPSGAQVNADITKAEIEAKLTGAISSHSHTGGSDPFVARLVISGDKATGANVTPVTLGVSFTYAINSTYLIDFYLMVAPTAATTGCGVQIDVSSVVTYVGSFVSHQLAISGTISGSGSIGDNGVTSSGVSSGMVGTGSNFVSGSAMIITTSNTGTATFMFRSETTAVTTCKSGSVIRVMKL
jgi:hypothetical protein